jgi:MFS family permease
VAAGVADGVFESILVATASLYLGSIWRPVEGGRLGWAGVGTVAGALLAARWVANIFIAPLVGRLSDRLQQHHTALGLAGIVLLGILCAASGQVWLAIPALLLVLLLSAGLFVTLSASAAGVAVQSEDRDLFAGLYNTAVDVGTGVGPLFAFSLAGWLGLVPLYVLAGLLQFAVIARYWTVEQAALPASFAEPG